MATVISLVNVKSPFKAVAEYPPSLPYIGQDNAYHRLQDFTQSIRAEEQAHFLALFGDWAIGKSRLAHELIAQVSGESCGWTLTTGERADPLLLPLVSGGETLPLFVSFIDAFKFEQHDIDSGTVIGKVTCAAAAYLADIARARNSHYQLLQAVRTALTAVNPNFDFDRIAAIATDTSRSYAERAEQLVKAFGAMTNGRVRRILVIVDEVESGADVNPFAEELDKIVTSRPIPRRAVRDLYSGVKDASNTNAYPALNFLFFNTETAQRLARMDALDRRMLTADLDKASATDLDRMLDALRQGGYPLSGLLEDLARRAFFAADRSFGWFSFIMGKAHYILAETPELSVGQVFAEVCKRTGKVFQPGVFEDRDIQPRALKDAMRQIVYNQIPTTLSDLGIDPGLRPAMLAYQDPFQTRFIGETALLAVSADLLTRGLLETGLYTSDVQPSLTGEGSVRFNPAVVLDSLRTFAWPGQGNSGASAHLWIYTDPADFENQVDFAYSGFGVDLSAATVRTMHKLLMERCRVASEAQSVAPTMALLRRFNDLWGKAAANDWLPEEEWARVISAIERSPEQNDYHLLQGIANVLFDLPQPQTSPAPYPDVTAQSLTLKLESHEMFNVTSRNQLVLLKARETPQGIADDLRAIGQRVPVLLIFGQSRQLDEWERYAQEAHAGHLSVAVISHVVEPQTREWEFYVRYSLRDTPEGFKTGSETNRGKDLRAEFRNVLHERFKQWLAAAEQQGYVLRPFYPAKSATTPAFRDFASAWAKLLRAGDIAALGAERAATVKDMEDYERERHGNTLQLTEDADLQRHAVIPPVVAHVLTLLGAQSRKMNELADDVFFIRSQRTVNFPTSGTGVMEQLLTLLQEIGVVEMDAHNRYALRSIASFNSKFDQAFQRLGSQEGDRSGYALQVASLSDPVKTLAAQFDVNDDQLTLLRVQKLLPERDRLGKLPLDRLTAVPVDQAAFAEVARSIGAVSTALDEVLGKQGPATPPPTIDPQTLQGNINDIAADKGYRAFSIEYRVTFLQQLQDYLTHAEQDLRARLAASRASLASVDTEGDSAFPTRPLRALLDAVEADLDQTLPGNTLPPQLRRSSSDASLKVLKGAGRLSDVLLKLDWYAAQLDEQNSAGWWVQYTSAREQWKAATSEFRQVEDTWARLNRYFAGTAPEHAIMFTGAELGPNVQELGEAVASFGERMDDKDAKEGLEDLAKEVAAIRANCASLAERIQAARTNADAEITAKLNDSHDAAVKRLADRLNKTNILPDRQRVLEARTHQEAHQALDNYQQAVAKTGASLCDGRVELYQLYLQIYHDHSQGMTGEQIVQRYGEEKLRAMSERKLVTLRYTIDV